MSLGTPEALSHLRRDPALKRVIRQVGPCTLKPARRQPYEALVRAIAHQQVHGRAAEAILGRFLACCPGPGFPAPEAVLALSPETMRGCGLSANKVLAIRDIAEKAAAGIVPSRAAARRLSDEALIERLLPLRGVGRWTVEMLLIFTLGRPDVLPVDDFGVREGYRLAAGLPEQPRPKALAEIGLAWAPYRTTAAWYLWRAADLAKEGRFRPPQAL
ncbi:DNA-3-methyladenine glycosylase 2 family protein [Roseomonas alkaliterrae]|uniref:DNA-3-methyladenine glycosylase II n=1 Tax=Neoroseomonas alkaliterrae TaxID=1452450 RepID=A0A840Y5T3_9PROT|nr:DNA-3-methyladenine glycosylase [Neoroseomonas alkaliterrae]MBB5689453.1 DNA-3-methyladenine glycosylase II [Neoroseomonas alkaliterrae]MBR0677479.1 DNA-3-methyladenine glycosylase 2 family protein [Neoroseomonas alkaliterrae]